MEKPQCLKNKTGLFGRKYQKYEHEWAYKNKEERQCVYCKRKEIFLDTERELIICLKIGEENFNSLN